MQICLLFNNCLLNYCNVLKARWAWTEGNRPLIEQMVAPRIVPMDWYIKIPILLLGQWVFVVLALYCHTFLPLLTGRMIARLLYVPVQYHHDTMNFVLGIMVLGQIFNAIRFLVTNFAAVDCLVTISKLPMSSHRQFVRIAMMFLGISFIVGIILLQLGHFMNVVALMWSYLCGTVDTTPSTVPTSMLTTMLQLSRVPVRPLVSNLFSYQTDVVATQGMSVYSAVAGDLLTDLWSTMMMGSTITLLITWSLCSGILRQAVGMLRMIPVVGNILGPGGAALIVIPDWNAIVLLFLRDMKMGSIERVIIHLQLTESSIVLPIFKALCLRVQINMNSIAWVSIPLQMAVNLAYNQHTDFMTKYQWFVIVLYLLEIFLVRILL